MLRRSFMGTIGSWIGGAAASGAIIPVRVMPGDPMLKALAKVPDDEPLCIQTPKPSILSQSKCIIEFNGMRMNGVITSMSMRIDEGFGQLGDLAPSRREMTFECSGIVLGDAVAT